MDIEPGQLVFTKDECIPLATMFAHYFRSPETDLSDAEKEALLRIWARVSDMSILPLIPSSQELLAELFPRRGQAVTQEEIADGKIAIPHTRGFTSVIRWAAEELVVGSPTHASLVGQTPDADYENLTVNQILDEGGESLTRRAESMLAAGQVAAAWVAQLDH